MDSDSGPLPILLLDAFFNLPTSATLIAIAIILLFLFFSGLMSASEVAFFSLTNPEIDQCKDSDDPADNKVAKLHEKPRFLLSTILIINNTVNIGVVITSYFVTKQMLNFQDLDLGFLVIPGLSLEFTWNVIIVTFFLVLFGEATPKVYATQNKLGIARMMAGFFVNANRILFPLNYVLVGSTQVIEKKLKRHNAEIDIEEINKAIEITVEKKESKMDAKMLKGIVHFGNITVKQVMHPRTDVSAIDIEMNFEELIQKVREVGYSRFPVYQDDLDHVVGVLNVKDLLQHVNNKADFDWRSLVRDAFFVTETKKIDDLLREIQVNRKHLAVVVDEFGGTSGIITLEDIVEEVVGDIKDEFDENTDSDLFRKLDDKNYLVEGKIALPDMCKLMELDSDTFEEARGEAETLGGLLLELIGRIPKNGEEARFGKFKFLVISVVNNRIEKVKVTNDN
jgi:gliding motility-associated protein GldE